MSSVYIETSVPSFYFETRRDSGLQEWRRATRGWWDRYSSRYQLYTSGYVRAELAAAPRPKASRMLSLVEDVSTLEIRGSVERVVQYYIQNHLMPAKAGGDAFHLAMASVHRMDFLLTWNCQHLANANKFKQIGVLNRRLGLHVPVITTPYNLMPEEDDES